MTGYFFSHCLSIIVITKIASIALVHTTLLTGSAKFQARSAYTGAELVPRRQKIL
jgi:hypothetical protein